MQRNLPQLLHLEPEGKGAGGGQELLHLLGAGWACQSLQSNFRLLPPLSQGEKPDDPQAGVGNPQQQGRVFQPLPAQAKAVALKHQVKK